MTLLEALARKNLILESEISQLEAEMASSGMTIEDILEKRGISRAEVMKANIFQKNLLCITNLLL